MARTTQTFAPPVMEARRWLSEPVLPDGVPLINVSQAAPVDPPPEAMRLEIARIAVEEPQAHLYGPVLGLPGLAVATGTAGGAPVGVQLIASKYREDVLFEAGAAIEAACGAPQVETDI